MYKKCSSLWPNALLLYRTVLLLMSAASPGTGFDWPPEYRMDFGSLGWILLIGSPVLYLLTEWLRGTYR